MNYKKLLAEAKEFYISSIRQFDEMCLDNISNLTENFSIVSFDIFDTLCTRLFECPLDVFAYVTNILEEHHQNLDNFGVNRFIAEEKARNIAWQLEHREDIKFDEIYEQLFLIYPDQREAVKLAKEIELNAELDSIVANSEQIQLIKRLKNLDKKIIFVSDIYFPFSFMENLLKKIGLNLYDKLYLSSEFMKAKYTGNIWNIVLNDNPNETIFHIGDNINSDVYLPKKHNIETYHYDKWMGERRVGAELASSLVPFSIMSKIQRLQNNISENKVQNSKLWYELGESLGGILLKSFIDWLSEQIITEEIDHIYFFSRDAQIIYKAWNLLEQDQICGTKSSYFYIARNSIRYPSCHIDLKTHNELSEASLYLLVEETILPGDTWRLYFKRLGIKDENIKKTSFSKKFNSLDDIIDYKYVNELKDFIQQELLCFLEPIFETEYENALKYYEQEGILDPEKNIAVVDLGWGGTNQLALTEFRRFIGVKKKIRGYYYGLLFKNAPGRLYSAGPMKTSFFNMFWLPHDPTLMQNFMYILENLHSANHETTIGFKKNDFEKYEPVFRKDLNNQYINHFESTYKRFQDGALNTLSKWKNNELVYGIDKNFIDLHSAISALFQICISPNDNELKILGSIKHALIFDHSVSANLVKKELPIKEEDIVPMMYLWPCGVMSYWKKNKNKIDPSLYKKARDRFETFPFLIKNYFS